jgi:hypothetical protein
MTAIQKFHIWQKLSLNLIVFLLMGFNKIPLDIHTAKSVLHRCNGGPVLLQWGFLAIIEHSFLVLVPLMCCGLWCRYNTIELVLYGVSAIQMSLQWNSLVLVL